jgi:hypothetical protein
LSVDRKLFGTSTIGSHPARSAPAVAPHDSPRSADACRSAIGRPILSRRFSRSPCGMRSAPSEAVRENDGNGREIYRMTSPLLPERISWLSVNFGTFCG